MFHFLDWGRFFSFSRFPSFLSFDTSFPPRPLIDMGPAFRQYLDGPKIYGCAACKAHVADHDDIVSKVKRK